jgi:hypothetical protein
MAVLKVKRTPKYHDAGTGKFVTPTYAKTHPKTTAKESGSHPKKAKKS